MVIDDVEIEMWPGEREQSTPFDIQANETFVEVVKHVRGIVDDIDISYEAWSARTAGMWHHGLYFLLELCNCAGATLPDELLDRCMETEWGDGFITKEVEELRTRAREAASG